VDLPYADYLDSEWNAFLADPQRERSLLESTRGVQVRRILDVGCGAGQELSPFARRGAIAVGIDLDAQSAARGRQLYASAYPDARIGFVTGAAESLPFHESSFDVAICRVALPYTDNRRALAEMGRVLRPGGLLLLKIQRHRYYVAKMMAGLRSGEIRSAIHAVRVMAAGALYHVTGRQPRTRWPSRETFQSESMLRRELLRVGMEISGHLADSNPSTPSLVIRKMHATC
jgi:ubiquinone/menaquinone biosynthesis C-methylase UbiE